MNFTCNVPENFRTKRTESSERYFLRHEFSKFPELHEGCLLDVGANPEEAKTSSHRLRGCKTVTAAPEMSCAAARQLHQQSVDACHGLTAFTGDVDQKINKTVWRRRWTG